MNKYTKSYKDLYQDKRVDLLGVVMVGLGLGLVVVLGLELLLS